MPEDTIVDDGETNEDISTELTKDDEEDKVEDKVDADKADAKDGDDDGNSKDGDKKADKDDKGAPEKYEDFTLPEGMEKDEKALEVAGELFKELDLTQDQAQKLVDYQTEQMQQTAEAMQEAWDELFAGWAAETKADKEIGGKDFDANVAIAKTAVKEYATDEFKEMLNSTGIGNHPEMVRFLVNVGKSISDDQILGGKSSGGGPVDHAARLFPTMKN
jgi:hypothetical protein